MSVDALRGVAVLICVITAFALPVFFQLPDAAARGAFVTQLSPSEWDGITLNDISMPIFLLVAGASTRLAFARHAAAGGTRRQWMLRAIRRAGILIFVGVIFEAVMSPHWLDLRLSGPLQRIALCYLACAFLEPIVATGPLVGLAAFLLTNYGLALSLFDFPGAAAERFAQDNNLCAWVDSIVLPGRGNFGRWDSFGVLSTVPALTLALIGSALARCLGATPDGKSTGVPWLLGTAFLCLNLGWLLGEIQPINGTLLTPPFVLLTAGIVCGLWGVLHWLAISPRTRPIMASLQPLGRNSLLIVVLTRVATAMQLVTHALDSSLIRWMDNVAPIAVLLLILIVVSALAVTLYRRRIFITV